MTFDLDCDTCEFARTVETESSAYDGAKRHEQEHPSHFVLITTRNPQEA